MKKETLKRNIQKYNQAVSEISKKNPSLKNLLPKKTLGQYAAHMKDDSFLQAEIKEMRKINNRTYNGMLVNPTTRDKTRIESAISDYRKKRNQIIRKDPEMREHIKPINKRNIEKSMRTPEDITQFVKYTKDFTKAKIEKREIQGYKTTNFEIRQAQIKNDRINAAKEKRRKENPIEKGSGLMHSLEQLDLRERKDITDRKFVRPADVERYLKATDKQGAASFEKLRGKQYKINYLKGIKSKFGHKRYVEVAAMINAIQDDDFIDMTINDVFLDFDWVYGEEESDFRFSKFKDALHRSFEEYKENVLM